MTTKEVRDKYLAFFEKRGHKIIPPAPLVLENDPTTLFTSSGMQPLVPYLLGETHPEGKRLVDSQPSIRTQDIEEVGDNRHTTFFEMLGNWSLGDYFKAEQLPWFFEFLTSKEEGLGLDPKKLFVSVFEGDENVGKDFESIGIWKEIFESVGMEAEEGDYKNGVGENDRIFPYPAKKNWWSRSGTPDEMPAGEIGGPDSEVFYDFGEEHKFHENSPWKDEKCHPNCDCGRFVEIGNSVFIQYKKQENGTLEELPNKNVDFGGGLERLVAATNNDADAFKIDIFSELISEIETQVSKKYEEFEEAFRIITDHVRGATFLARDIVPSNKQQGYIMRRLIRRSALKARELKNGTIEPNIFTNLVSDVANLYKDEYFRDQDIQKLQGIIFDEVQRFTKTLEKGLKEVEKIEKIDSQKAFDLYQTYGFPLEITEEIYAEKGQKINKEEFVKEFEKHKDKSRTASAGMFKGGLADQSENTVKYHTATHLLQWALREVLGDHVRQKGSNITGERLRFDFSHSDKLTDEESEKVIALINQKVDEKCEVQKITAEKDAALAKGALFVEGAQYPDTVSVYCIGGDLDSAFSKELCGGPHVNNTGEIGHVTMVKQEKIGEGLVRMYLKLK